MQTIVTNCTKDLADLLPLMPRGVDLGVASRPSATSVGAVSSIDIGENRTHKTQCESDCKDCLCYGFHCRFPLLTTGSLSPARQLDVTNHTVRPWAQRTQNPAADQDGSPQAERRFIGTISADLYFDPRCGCPAAGLLVPAQAVVTN